MKVKIRLDTLSHIKEFSSIVSFIENDVVITDNNGLCVNAKSQLGVMYAMEFKELWCECDIDIYTKINKFIVEK